MKPSLTKRFVRGATTVRPHLAKARNPTRYRDSFHLAPSGVAPYSPISRGIFISVKCDLDSDFYRNGAPAGRIKIEDFSVERFALLLDHPLHGNAARLSFGGGEGLMRKGYFGLADLARKSRKLSAVFTNGLPLKHKAKRIVDSPINSVMVSLYDGHVEKQYAIVAELLRERSHAGRGPQIALNRIVGASTMGRMAETLQMAASLKVDGVFFQNTFPMDKSAEAEVIFDDNGDFTQLTASLRGKYPEMDVTFPTPARRNRARRLCPQPFQAVSVNPEGNLGSCGYMTPNERYGKIPKNPNAGHSGFMLDLRQSLLDPEKPLQPECAKCWLLGNNLY